VPEDTIIEETGRPGKILNFVFRLLCFTFLIRLGRIAFFVICFADARAPDVVLGTSP
jgi:hypothetical protein